MKLFLKILGIIGVSILGIIVLVIFELALMHMVKSITKEAIDEKIIEYHLDKMR